MSAKEYYHLIPESEWRSCVSESRPYFPATYDADGFTHLSDNTGVLLTIGNHFYKQIKGTFLVIAIDSSKLSHEVKLEPAAPVGETQPHFDGNEQLFPHLYGPINIDSAVKEMKVVREDDGTFIELI